MNHLIQINLRLRRFMRPHHHVACVIDIEEPATPAANCKPPLTSCMPPCTRGCPVQEPTILRPFLKSLHRFVGSSLGGASLGSGLTDVARLARAAGVPAGPLAALYAALAGRILTAEALETAVELL